MESVGLQHSLNSPVAGSTENEKETARGGEGTE